MAFLALLAIVSTPLSAGTSVITGCLEPCHTGIFPSAPDIKTAYESTDEAAGHAMNWDPRIVADASGAQLLQGAKMPCDECHVGHETGTRSILQFSEVRTGGRVTVVRDLCEGCHRPYDSVAATPTVQGLLMAKLPGGPDAHADADTTPCGDCHGSTAHIPEGHGGGGLDCGDVACHGGSGSHAIHLSDADARGPGELACDDCHETDGIPAFASGDDTSGNGSIELDETDVCDACHSPGGSYDGVESTTTASGGVSVGAKDNWASKVYQTANSLQAGKDKWCAGCHDGDASVSGEEPSLVDGVYAPPVIGDESGSYIYGTGWGYYETGHGTSTSTALPSNGSDRGPGLECDDCHDYLQTHIDGDRRSFTSTGTPTTYRTSYRLDLVDGMDPMLVPWQGATANSSNNYRLCTQSGCHDPWPYLNEAVDGTSTPSSRRTNFWKEAGNNGNYNMHKYHLEFSHQNRWARDWGGSNNSRITCISCHNVHGSQYLAMIHDGSLISDTVAREPGLRIWYWDDTLSVWAENNPDPPSPEDITLAMSEGWVWRGGTSSNLCGHCHFNNNTLDVQRALWQSYGIAPVLDWTGEAGYEDDGADPDTESAAGTFAFRVSYADGSNDAPSFVNLLIDRNDDGDFDDANEVEAMAPVSPGDQTYYNGNIYHADLALAKGGDNTLSYRFEAGDGVTGTSSTPTRTVTVTNAVPELQWTGDVGYSTDGVAPNSGTTDITDYEFRITYKDADGEAPSGGAPTLYVDKNDDGDFGDASEVSTMSAMSGGDFVNGKRYTYTTKLTYNVDGLVPYYFETSDGIDTAQSAAATVTVLQDINLAPSLAWTNEPEYRSDGVDPENQAAKKPFFFRVTYTDANNDPPGVAEVWIDLDDDTVYEPGEKFTMNDSVTATDTAMTDGDYSNGEIFAEKYYVDYAGDGTLTYCFHFEDDNAAEATGVYETDRNLSVYTALDVPSEYATIQLAVNAATTSQTVLVADGTWAGWIFNNKDIYVESVNGAASTIVQNPGGRAVEFNYYSGNPSNSVVSGFTFSNSNYGAYANMSVAKLYDCIFENNGFAVFNGSSSAWPVTIEDCIIRNNTSCGIQTTNNTCIVRVRDTEFSGNTGTNGSCLTGNGGNFWFDRCTFDGNTATSAGGAIYMSSISQSYIRDCVFTNNTAGTTGGAIYYNGNGSATDTWVERCVFAGNQAAVGGALHVRQGDYDIDNCTFSGNYATGAGGAIRTEPGNAVFTNCTIAGNSGDFGGGIYAQNNTTSQPDIHNCILWGNDSRSTLNEAIDSYDLSRVEVQYTDIDQTYTGFWAQTGNMTSNPLFVDPVVASAAPTTTGDYHIQTGSPVEGQASATYAPADDIDNGDRPQGTGDDMGSDEIGAAAAARAPESITMDVPGLDPADPIVIPMLPTGMSVTPDEPSAMFAPTFTERDEGFLLVGSGAGSIGSGYDSREPMILASKGHLGERGTRPLGVPTSAPLAVGFASFMALAWRAIIELLRALR